MNCRKAQGLIDSYINETISTEDLSQYLRHVEHCPSCYDDLETNFIVFNALHRLDDDVDGNFDMHDLLQKDLRHKHHIVRRRTLLRVILTTLVVLATAAVLTELFRGFGLL